MRLEKLLSCTAVWLVAASVLAVVHAAPQNATSSTNNHERRLNMQGYAAALPFFPQIHSFAGSATKTLGGSSQLCEEHVALTF
jgi:hypothetical protein